MGTTILLPMVENPEQEHKAPMDEEVKTNKGKGG